MHPVNCMKWYDGAVCRQDRHGSSYYWPRWHPCSIWRRQQSLDISRLLTDQGQKCGFCPVYHFVCVVLFRCYTGVLYAICFLFSVLILPIVYSWHKSCALVLVLFLLLIPLINGRSLGISINIRDHSFTRTTEFLAEPWNLFVSAEFLCFHRILQNSVILGHTLSIYMNHHFIDVLIWQIINLHKNQLIVA